MKNNEVWQDVLKIRRQSPLVHNITNYVVMNNTANALLSLGVSPVMAHAEEEVEEMTSLSRALVLNIGTLSNPWVEAMIKAGKMARHHNIPVIFDPVGSGSTNFRTSTAKQIIKEVHPTIIRGNASEIKSLGAKRGRTRGVDSSLSPDEVLDDARDLSLELGCVVSVSGAVDVVVLGENYARISNGNLFMSQVTGMGCTASAVTAAFAAVNDAAFAAAVNAMVLMGVAGELAAQDTKGPGSFQLKFIDSMYAISESDLHQKAQVSYAF